MWLCVFRQVANQFARRVARADSFSVSFDALVKVYAKEHACHARYLRQACINAQIDLLPKGPQLKPPVEGAYEGPWDAIDLRLDLGDALATLALETPLYGLLVAGRLAGKTLADLVGETGYCERHVLRLMLEAEARMKRLLEGGYGDGRP
jgi:hypothetical protein